MVIFVVVAPDLHLQKDPEKGKKVQLLGCVCKTCKNGDICCSSIRPTVAFGFERVSARQVQSITR